MTRTSARPGAGAPLGALLLGAAVIVVGAIGGGGGAAAETLRASHQCRVGTGDLRD